MTAKRVVIASAGVAVGRTAMAVNLAVELARGGWLVLLADLDPEAGATRALGLEPARDPWREDAVPVSGVEGLAVQRGGRGLAGATAPDVGVLLNATPTRDIVVVDTPPELTTIPAAAAERADLLLVPVRPGAEAVRELRAAAQLLRLVQTTGGCELRAVVVRSADPAAAGAARAELDQAYPGAAYQTVVPEDPFVAEAMLAGTPLLAHAPGSAAAAACRMLAIEVAADLERTRGAAEPAE